jgi:hypothetical protein
MKKNVLLSVALIWAISNVGVAGSLTGTVRNALTSAPIGGAIVSAHILLPDSIGLYDTADVAGTYAITDIPPGNQIYVIMAYAPGYKGYYLRFEDLGAGVYEFDVLLESEAPPPPGGGGDSTYVSGYVMGQSGSGGSLVRLNGATVDLTSGGAKRSVTTDGNGYYSTVVATGSYSVSVTAQGYLSSASSGIAVTSDGLSYGAVLQGEATDVSETVVTPSSFVLHEAYPNPFNPATTISFVLPTESRVLLRVYDIQGREVSTLADAVYPSGPYALQFDALWLSSGIYFVRMEAAPTSGTEKFISMRRLVVLR